MKKFFTLVLTAMFAMTTQAQDFADYASVIGQSYNQLSRTYSDLEELFEGSGFYQCAPNDGKTESLMIVFNDDLEAYMVSQTLKEDAYTLDQIVDYMNGKYKLYEVEVNSYSDEETGEQITTMAYSYGNTENKDDATLLIEFSDNTSINYTNPQLAPTFDSEGLGDMSPIEVVDTFLGLSLDDILDEYPGIFDDTYGIGLYVAMASEDNEWLESAVLLLDDDNVATSIRLNFAGSDEEVIAYYTENGYTCTETGSYEEEGETYKTYTITNGTYTIEYSGDSGTVTKTGETGINSVKLADSNAVWYSIDGIRLNAQPTKKGLYVNGGKKVIIK